MGRKRIILNSEKPILQTILFFYYYKQPTTFKKNCIYLQQCHFKGYGILKDMDMAAQNFIIQLSNAFGQ